MAVEAAQPTANTLLPSRNSIKPVYIDRSAAEVILRVAKELPDLGLVPADGVQQRLGWVVIVPGGHKEILLARRVVAAGAAAHHTQGMSLVMQAFPPCTCG